MAGRSPDLCVRRAALRHLDGLVERARAGVDEAARELVAIGTPEAKGALFNALHRTLVADAQRRCGDEHAAEDAAVRAFDAAWEITAVRGRKIESSLIGYFRNAAKSSGSTERIGALNLSRGMATDPHVLIDLTEFPDAVGDVVETMHNELETATIASAVNAGLDALPPRSREILDVRLATTNLRDAAETLGMTTQAAKVGTARATKTLRATVLQLLAPKAAHAPEQCRPVLSQLGLLLTGQLDADAAAGAMEHLEACERCAAAHEKLEAAKKRHFASRLMRGFMPLPLLRGFARSARWATRSAPRAVGAASTAAVLVASVGLATVPALRPWQHPVIEAPSVTPATAGFSKATPPYATPVTSMLTLFPSAAPGSSTPHANASPIGLGIGGHTDPSGQYDPLKNAPIYVATPAVPFLAGSAPLLELSLDPFANVPQARPAGWPDPQVHADASDPTNPKVETARS